MKGLCAAEKRSPGQGEEEGGGYQNRDGGRPQQLRPQPQQLRPQPQQPALGGAAVAAQQEGRVPVSRPQLPEGQTTNDGL